MERSYLDKADDEYADAGRNYESESSEEGDDSEGMAHALSGAKYTGCHISNAELFSQHLACGKREEMS